MGQEMSGQTISAQAEMMPLRDECRAGERLSANVVENWERRIGIDPSDSSTGSTLIRLQGRAGLAQYGGDAVEADSPDPDAFESRMYVRQLSQILTFCHLVTPFREVRDERRARKSPWDVLMVGVHTMAGRSVIRQGAHEIAYRPGRLVFVNAAKPFAQQTKSIIDPSGLIIPHEYLGAQRRNLEHVRRPVLSDTLLSRATAAFVRQFASTTVIGDAAEVDTDTESAAVELVGAALGQVDLENHQLADNRLFVRQAALDLIERHHPDPEFTPELIARTLHISRRQLYRHFEESDGSLATLIAERRLLAAHEMLLEDRSLSIAAISIAAGFPSVATMRNRFRARFEMTPNDLRMRR